MRAASRSASTEVVVTVGASLRAASSPMKFR